jgi:hypothetical protein
MGINYVVIRHAHRRAALRIKTPEVSIVKSGNTYTAVSSQISLSYVWSVTGGTITAGSGTQTITVSGTPTIVSVTATNANGKSGSATI